ncbi:N-acyl-D-amino-acid deacylase family protein [Planctomicrobium sp. SH664]|uniref:N-acyl-D-amino-acid deacylase family protein n=1 Tax=Planctomicrobium sp. SH664 TaxID=3448125 RepID=UPI003F5B120B
MSHASSLLICLMSLAGVCHAQSHDVVIKNATIHDGTGAPGSVGHVAFTDGKITFVGSGSVPKADWIIDGTGLVVSPGFIDLHTHSDTGITTPSRRSNVNFLMQGCTTSVTGNCGSGPVKLKEYYDKVDVAGAGTNVAHLLPQGSLRAHVCGSVDRKATPEEIAEMSRLAQVAMNEGAWGMSTGLIYTPGMYTSTEELVQIAKVIASAKGIYASHIRGEGATLATAVAEAIQIGEQAGLPVHVSHLKASGQKNWGTIRLAMNLIEEARKKGQSVTADQYPYTASSTSLDATLFPGWARSGGSKKLIQRLKEPESGDKIRAYVSTGLADRNNGASLVVARFAKRADWSGRSLKQIAADENKSPLQIAEYIVMNGGASIVNHGMSEEDVRLAMTAPWVATASDGSAQLPGVSRPHPRSYGTFSRKIGFYSIRENVIPLEAAIRSASGLPADIIGMRDRGYLKPGLVADVVVFDPKSFVDQATFEQPYQFSAGLKYVFVNGVPAVIDGEPTGALAGKALRKPASH